ncbi:MAG: cadherin-like domain-containing protein, partial [Deltaproteobacteria bacterium]|nr:cadherin-like domain-containing protein [Deltaproteobacteria bacterium]
MLHLKTTGKVGLIFLLSVLAWAMVLVIPEMSLATTWPVINTADSGQGSLRAALAELADGDTIILNVTGTIFLNPANGPLVIANKNITIIGSSDGVAISGSSQVSIFKVSKTGATISALTIRDGKFMSNGDAGGAITVEASGGLTLSFCDIAGNISKQGGGIYNAGTLSATGCNFISNISHGQGGGIYNTGTLNLDSCTFSGNTANGQGGGIYNDLTGTVTLKNCTFNSSNNAQDAGGGVSNTGTLSATNCTFNSNYASNNSGGGIYNNGTLNLYTCTISGNYSSSGSGGGVANAGTLSAVSCTISSNHSSYGGGIYNNGTLSLDSCSINGNNYASNFGGGAANAGTLSATNCTIDGNRTTAGPGGGIYNFSTGKLTLTSCTASGNSSTSDVGGGVANAGTLSAVNCTISGNTTNSKGGGVANQGALTLTNCTITNNTDNSKTAAGLYQYGAAPTASLFNNIIAANTGGGNVKSISGTLTSLGYNLVGENTGGYFIATDIINNLPVLGALSSNGGQTKTHALLAGSPAIDAGTCTGAPATDQRGVTRPQDGKGIGTAACDIGSYEKENPNPGRVNAPPIANYQYVAALRSAGSIPITLSGSDWDGDTLSYTIVSNPTHGTLSGTPPNLTYAYRSQDQDPKDSFKFKVTAGGYSRTGVVDIEFFITKPTLVPTAAHDQNVTTTINQPLSLMLTSSDWNNLQVSYTIVTAPAHGTLSGNTKNWAYTPTANYTGYDYFTFKADNGTGRYTYGRINIMVGVANWPPVAAFTWVRNPNDHGN